MSSHGQTVESHKVSWWPRAVYSSPSTTSRILQLDFESQNPCVSILLLDLSLSPSLPRGKIRTKFRLSEKTIQAPERHHNSQFGTILAGGAESKPRHKSLVAATPLTEDRIHGGVARVLALARCSNTRRPDGRVSILRRATRHSQSMFSCPQGDVQYSQSVLSCEASNT